MTPPQLVHSTPVSRLSAESVPPRFHDRPVRSALSSVKSTFSNRYSNSPRPSPTIMPEGDGPLMVSEVVDQSDIHRPHYASKVDLPDEMPGSMRPWLRTSHIHPSSVHDYTAEWKGLPSVITSDVSEHKVFPPSFPQAPGSVHSRPSTPFKVVREDIIEEPSNPLIRRGLSIPEAEDDHATVFLGTQSAAEEKEKEKNKGKKVMTGENSTPRSHVRQSQPAFILRHPQGPLVADAKPITSPRASDASVHNPSRTAPSARLRDESGRDLYHRHGDVALKASDGTIFMVDGWRLAMASTTYQYSRHDKVNSTQTIFSTEPIDLNINADLAETFVNLISVSRAFPLLTSFDETTSLLDLCEEMSCRENILESITNRLRELGEQQPWALLIFAAQCNHVGMGRMALSKMTFKTFFAGGVEDVCPGRKHFWTRLSRLPSPWMAGLLQAALYARGFESSAVYIADSEVAFKLRFEKNWESLSENFEPMSEDVFELDEKE